MAEGAPARPRRLARGRAGEAPASAAATPPDLEDLLPEGPAATEAPAGGATPGVPAVSDDPPAPAEG